MGQEKNFENRVKKWLRDNGCYVCKFYGCGTTRSGVPDLLVCAGGRFIGIELKAENGTVSELQKANLKAIERAGGIGIELRPSGFARFKKYIRGILADDR